VKIEDNIPEGSDHCQIKYRSGQLKIEGM